jgi:hypothetical protein
MLTLKKGFEKEKFHRFFKAASEEIRICRETTMTFANIHFRNAFVRFAGSFRKKEAIAVSVVLVLSLISSAFVVGTGYKERKINSFAQDMTGMQILGNENTVATKTLSKLPESEIKEEPAVSASEGTARRTEDIFTPSQAAYNMENRELLAQMMFAEEGVFFSRFANDPEMIERVHKLAGSVVLHRLNSHFSGAQTLADVLYAPGQYDYRTIQRVEQGQNLPPQVYQWAEELLTEGALGPDTLVFQAEFPQGKEVYDHIGNQYFCCR